MKNNNDVFESYLFCSRCGHDTVGARSSVPNYHGEYEYTYTCKKCSHSSYSQYKFAYTPNWCGNGTYADALDKRSSLAQEMCDDSIDDMFVFLQENIVFFGIPPIVERYKYVSSNGLIQTGCRLK